MFSNYIKEIEGVGFYSIFSMLVFFVFFVVMFIWMLKLDKNYVNEMEQLPLDSENNPNKKLSGDHNGE